MLLYYRTELEAAPFFLDMPALSALPYQASVAHCPRLVGVNERNKISVVPRRLPACLYTLLSAEKFRKRGA